MEQLIGIRDAAARLGTCTSTLRQWDKENKLVAVKTAGGHRRYRLSDVDRFIGNEEVEVKENVLEKLGLREVPDSTLVGEIRFFYHPENKNLQTIVVKTREKQVYCFTRNMLLEGLIKNEQ